MQLNIIRRLLPDFGTTYGPPGDGPFPTVLVLHGSEGALSGWSHRTSAILAASGFLAYPHGYSRGGNAWNAGSIEDVDLSRTVEALDSLKSFSASDGKIGLYGVSRGAEHALLVASLMAKYNLSPLPDAIACLAAPDVVCGAFDAKSYRDSGDPGWQAWDAARRAWVWNGSNEDLKPTTPIEVERIDCPMFLASGLQDQTWSPDMTKRLEARRKSAGLSVETHYYEDQGHVPNSNGENKHNQLLLDFLEKHLLQIEK